MSINEITVRVGAEWQPHPVERKHTVTGAYEFVNSPLHGEDEVAIQSALLFPLSSTAKKRLTTIQQLRGVVCMPRGSVLFDSACWVVAIVMALGMLKSYAWWPALMHTFVEWLK